LLVCRFVIGKHGRWRDLRLSLSSGRTAAMIASLIRRRLRGAIKWPFLAAASSWLK